MRSDEAQRAFDDGRREGRLETLAEVKEREREIRKEVWKRAYLVMTSRLGINPIVAERLVTEAGDEDLKE